MAYLLSEFTRIGRPLPIIGAYVSGTALPLPPGTFGVTDDSMIGPSGHQFASGRVKAAVQLTVADNPGMFKLTGWREHARAYFRIRAEILYEQREVSPVLAFFGERWYERVNDRAWYHDREILSDDLMSPATRAEVMRRRVDELIAVGREFFQVPFVQVERQYSPLSYEAKPFDNADYLGLCPAMTTDGLTNDETGDRFTTPLTGQANQAMLDKFYAEVGCYVSTATGYDRPIILIGQAWRDLTPNATYRQPPEPSQLEWWYVLAQRTPMVKGLIFKSTSIANGYYSPGMEMIQRKISEIFSANKTMKHYGETIPVPTIQF